MDTIEYVDAMTLHRAQDGPRAGPFMLAVLIVNILFSTIQFGGPSPAVEAQGSPSLSAAGWLNESFEYRIWLSVAPQQFDLVNNPAEVELNFTSLVNRSGFTMDLTSILLVVYIQSKNMEPPWTSGVGLPFRFYKAYGYDPTKNAKGTLTWLVSMKDGNTLGYYCLYFSSLPANGSKMNLPEPGDPQRLGMLDSNYWIQRGNVFYGYNPGEQIDWPDSDEVEVVGLYNETKVTIFNITDQKQVPTELANAVVDQGELWRYKAPDGDYFKVVAERPVVASVSSAMSPGGSAKTFYPSSDRNLVGRDFIIAPYVNTNWSGNVFGQQIYGIEESRVSIWDMVGNHIKELDVRKDNHTQLLDLKAGTVYHVKSTGDILIEQEAINGFTALPSVTGAPYGRKFFGSIQLFDSQVLEIASYELANVEIWNLDTGMVVQSHQTSSYLTYTSEIKPGAYRIESTGNISVLMGSCEGGTSPENLGDDISFIGGLGARDIYANAINNPGPGKKDHQYPGPYYSGIIFPFFNDTRVMIDGKTTIMDADHYLGLNAGGYHIISSRPISTMTLGRGYTDPNADHRWNDWGSYLAGGLTSPKIQVRELEQFVLGIDLYPSPSEGAVNDTMVHAVEPGKSTTFKVSVKNTGTFIEDLNLTIGIAPNGWNASLDKGQVCCLGAGHVIEVNLTVTVPINALKDTKVNISIHGDLVRTQGTAMNDTVYAEVVVDPVYFPELVGETVKYVDPGKTATFNLTLTNRGNGHDNITIGVDGQVPTGWTAVVLPTKASLDPLKNTTLRLNVTAPKDALAGASLVVDVRARSGAWPNRTQVHRTTTIVNQVYAFNASAPGTIKVRPGDEGIINLTLRNLGNGRDSLSFVIGGIRTGWSFKPQASVGLDPSASATVPFKFTVPGKDPATGKWHEGPGNWTVNFNVSDVGGLHKQLLVRIEVLQVFSVALSAEEYEISIWSNESAHYVLHIQNTGNGNDTYILTTEARGSFDKARVTVQPSGDGRVVLTVPPPAHRERYSTFVVTTNSSGNASASVTLTLRVTYPKVSSSIGDYNCLWILLVAACVFVAIKLGQRKFTKRRT